MIRPSAETAVASTISRPAPDSARWPRWIRCQSRAEPSLAEYWHIGAMMIRLARRSGPICERLEELAHGAAKTFASLRCDEDTAAGATRPAMPMTGAEPCHRPITIIEPMSDSATEIARDLADIGRIDAVPTLLRVLCDTTGMGFAAVARVTDGTWTACAVQDDIDFGLKPGGQLDVHTTLCRKCAPRARRSSSSRRAPTRTTATHHTPRIYGIESYVSVPIVLSERRVLRQPLRDRSAAGEGGRAAHRADVQPVRAAHRAAARERPEARRGASCAARRARRRRAARAVHRRCSATICAIRWPRSPRAAGCRQTQVDRSAPGADCRCAHQQRTCGACPR